MPFLTGILKQPMGNVGSQASNITGSFARTMRIAEHFRCELNRRCPIADSR